MPKSTLKAKTKAKTKIKAKATAKAPANKAPVKVSATAKKVPAAAPGKALIGPPQQIWLAGLGAFVKAQEEGTKWFEGLVREGTGLKPSSRNLPADQGAKMRNAVQTGMTAFKERTQETWAQLQNLMEERVAAAVSKLSFATRSELNELQARVEELSRELKSLKVKPVSRVPIFTDGLRRTKDDLSDIAKELEEAQLAARKNAKLASAQFKRPSKS